MPFAEFEAQLAKSLGVKERGPDFFQMELPRFTPVKYPALLDEILAAYIALSLRKVIDRHWSSNAARGAIKIPDFSQFTHSMKVWPQYIS